MPDPGHCSDQEAKTNPQPTTVNGSIDTLTIYGAHFNEYRPHCSPGQAAPLEPFPTRSRTISRSFGVTASAG
jgi:hypothetical protein